MEGLRCAPQNLPDCLYRVQHDYSQTKYSVEDGLRARDVETTYPETVSGKSRFECDLKKHLRWNPQEWKSPFISLFSDLDHALNWIRDRGNYWQLIAVSTSQLIESGIYIFRLFDLVKELGADLVPEQAKGGIEHEIFCLHRVPANAIQGAVSKDETLKNRLNTSKIEQLLRKGHNSSVPI